MLLQAQRANTGVRSHQIICINLQGILKSIKKLYVVILTKEKKTCIMKWKDKLQQKYNY